MRPIPGFPGYYAAKDGRIWSRYTNHWMSLSHDHYGYKQVSLNGGGRRRVCKVHRLILGTFVGPCPPGLECCHENDIKDDNRLENLRWGTRSSNGKDRVRNGGWPGPYAQGEQHGCAKLIEADVRQIVIAYENGDMNQPQLARQYGVHKTTIQHIICKKSWRHLWA